MSKSDGLCWDRHQGGAESGAKCRVTGGRKGDGLPMGTGAAKLLCHALRVSDVRLAMPGTDRRVDRCCCEVDVIARTHVVM
jgi:hypothetical protein